MEQLIEMDNAQKDFKRSLLSTLGLFITAINLSENTSNSGRFKDTYPGIDDLRDMIREFARGIDNG